MLFVLTLGKWIATSSKERPSASAPKKASTMAAPISSTAARNTLDHWHVFHQIAGLAMAPSAASQAKALLAVCGVPSAVYRSFLGRGRNNARTAAVAAICANAIGRADHEAILSRMMCGGAR